MTLAPPRQPIDPTLGELAVDAAARPRALDRRHRRQARRPQGPGIASAPGSRMSGDAEKVASVTEIHRELAGFNEARVRGGLPPLSDDAHQACSTR